MCSHCYYHNYHSPAHMDMSGVSGTGSVDYIIIITFLPDCNYWELSSFKADIIDLIKPRFLPNRNNPIHINKEDKDYIIH